MRIVITDGFTLNPGDLEWEAIAAFGDLTVYERTKPEDVIERCKDASVVLTNKVVFNSNELINLPQLKLICVLATGYNVIDVKAAKENSITVCNVPGYGTASVAQHTFALLLELVNHVGHHSQSVKDGAWKRSPDWCYFDAPLIELAGKTLGLIGFGNVGRQTARIARAFDMKVLYYTPTKKATDLAEYAEIETIFSRSDIVSLHCPLKDNHTFVNKDLLHRMKRSALLLNTARGQLIQEQDLADALNNGLIAGAGLDVLSVEPPVNDNQLLSAKNCIITPHNAWMSREARQRMMDITEANIKAFLEGQPVNVVSG